MTTPAAPTTIAEALDQGIALANSGATPPPPVADDAGESTDDTSTGDGSTDAVGAAAGDPAGDKPGDAGTGTGDDAGGVDSKDGKAATDDAGGDDAVDADKGADADAEADGTKEGKQDDPKDLKKPDHFNDPIPNALKRETKDRIRFLASDAKEQRTRADTATSERDELIKAVVDTGASPEQYAGVLDYLALVNSNDQNKLRAAANFMIRELSALSRIGGFRIPGVTTYSGHADLEKAVSEGRLAPELAEEISANRAAAAHQGKVGAAQQQASQARQRYEEADRAARAEMNTMETEFSRDPLYNEKKPIIVGMLNEMIKGDKKEGIPPLHPSKWPAAYKRLYQSLPASMGGLKPVARPGAGAAQPNGKVPANQPLRTQQPAGAQKQEPKSVQEAIDMGIEMARGG